jgi:ribosome recycling factor
MEETIESFMKKGGDLMDKAIDHLKHELIRIRTGKATASILDGIKVDYYGSPTLLSQMANITTPDSKTLSIQPWDKSVISSIEQAIFASNIGLTPMNDGENIRLSIPPLTEERRIDLVKQAKHYGEEAKVSLRNIRHKLLEFIKTEVKDGYPEDAGKRREDEVQKSVNEYGSQIDKIIEAKEKDIMSV